MAAQDGLILLRKGAGSRTIPPAFFTYAYADGSHVPHRLDVRAAGLWLLGYDVLHTDLPNHPVPNLAYSFYLRPTRSLHRDIQPVVYEVLGKTLVGCAHQPLGLAWLPTSRWSPRHTYVVRMDPLETSWQSPGRADLFVELRPVPSGRQQGPDCPTLWSRHGALWPVGSLTISF
ncbi:MAG: hypothetical protein JOZ41_08685 [Chloroflexi bacterium]|nr:hypothetical protein [Chloroflexota bacterium]